MQKITLPLIALLVLSLLAAYYWIDRTFAGLIPDEDRVLKETRSAYEKVGFRPEPFTKQKEIADLAAFLLRHFAEICSHNRHEEFRKIPLSEGRWTGYKNAGDCFEMRTFYRGFVETYYPPELVDSLYHYSAGLRDNLITGLTICGKAHPKNISAAHGSVTFTLVRERRKAGDGYVVFHHITFNRKQQGKKTLTSMYESGLSKDTTFLGEMKYEILVSPYTGL